MHKRLPGIVALFYVFCAMAAAQPTPKTPSVAPILQPHVHFINAVGGPCVGCKLYSFIAGTTTPAPTYSDSTSTAQNTNPVVLNVAGEADIWLGNNAYKFTLRDANGSLLWTADNVQGMVSGGGGGGGVPGGAANEVQINNGSGGFGSIPGFTYNGAANYLNGASSGLTLTADFIAGNNLGAGLNGGYMESLPNTAGSGIATNLMACVQSDGFAHACPTNTTFWNGLTKSASSTVASTFIAGTAPCLFDNTAVVGDFAVTSITTPGQCHDTGSAVMPSTGTLVGLVQGAPSGGVAAVNLMHGTVNPNGVLSVVNSAKPDRRTFTDVNISAGSTTLTSSNAAFTSADNGKLVTVSIGPQGVNSGTYSSGATVTGIAGQTCVLSGFNGGGTGADAYVTLTGTNTIGAGAAVTYTQFGTGFTSLPTTATLGNGSATCSGTATLTGGTFYVWPVTTTATYVSATSVTLGVAATTAASGISLTGGSIGTDNTPLIQMQVNASRTNDTCVSIPAGNYMLGSPIIVTGGECIYGPNGFLSAPSGAVLYPAAGSAAIATPDPSTNANAQLQNFMIRDLSIAGGQNGIDMGLSHFVHIDRVSCTDQSGWCISHIRGERHRIENIQCFHINTAGKGCISVADATNSVYAGSFATRLTAAITNVAVTSNVATITIASNSLFPEPAQSITITGLSNSFLNGTWTVTAGTATSFTFAVTHADLAATSDSGSAAYAWNDAWWDKSVIERISDQGPDNYTIWSNAGGPGMHPGSFSATRMNYIKGIAGNGSVAKSLVRLWSAQQSDFSDLGMDNVHASGTAVFDVWGFFNYSTVRNLVLVGPGNFYANGAYFHNDFQGSTVANSNVAGDNVNFVGLHFGTTTSMNGSVRDSRASIKVDASGTITSNHINVTGGLITNTTENGSINFSEQTNNNVSFLLAADQLGTTAATSDLEVNMVTAAGTVRKEFAVNTHGPAAPQGIINFSPIASNASPLNGDVYTKNTGLFAYINGSEVGPISGGCTTGCNFGGTTTVGTLSLTQNLNASATSMITWGAPDSGISRIAGGTFGFGNGTVNDVSGQVRAAMFRLTNSGFLNSFSSNTLTGSFNITAPNGNSATVMAAALVTTSGTSDNVAVQGMTASGHCSLTATNASAATNIATTYVSAKTTNQITVTHTATASMNYDVLCTPN